MDSYRITPGWLPVMSLHGSTAVTIDGRGFSSASPTSRLFAHFRLSGSDARWRAAKMAAVGSAHFRLQKRSSETYEWRHGHYVHVYGLQSMVLTVKLNCINQKAFLIN